MKIIKAALLAIAIFVTPITQSESRIVNFLKNHSKVLAPSLIIAAIGLSAMQSIHEIYATANMTSSNQRIIGATSIALIAFLGMITVKKIVTS